MKNLAIVIAFAAVLSTLIPQAAQAQYYGYGGVGDPNYGGATVFSDGSFTNNGVSWNGADPAGGWRGGPSAYMNPAAGGATGLLPQYARTRVVRVNSPVYRTVIVNRKHR